MNVSKIKLLILAISSVIFLIIALFSNVSANRDISWDKVNTLIQNEFPRVKQISTNELVNYFNSETNFILIDSREPDEYALSHISNAINIQNPSDISKITDNQNSLIIAYCSVGYRSSQFVAKLNKLGYKNSYNLKGSIFKWVNEGHPVYKNDRLTKKVHPYNEYWGQLLKRDNR